VSEGSRINDTKSIEQLGSVFVEKGSYEVEMIVNQVASERCSGGAVNRNPETACLP